MKKKTIKKESGKPVAKPAMLPKMEKVFPVKKSSGKGKGC